MNDKIRRPEPGQSFRFLAIPTTIIWPILGCLDPAQNDRIIYETEAPAASVQAHFFRGKFCFVKGQSSKKTQPPGIACRSGSLLTAEVGEVSPISDLYDKPSTVCPGMVCRSADRLARIFREIMGLGVSGAQERTRTFTAVKPLAPEASASTNSATWARAG